MNATLPPIPASPLSARAMPPGPRRAGEDQPCLRKAGRARCLFLGLADGERVQSAPVLRHVASGPSTASRRIPHGGFAELAKSSPLPSARAEAQLRLMNGIYGGDGEPTLGQLVKVVN
jgi:hypothetical protein